MAKIQCAMCREYSLKIKEGIQTCRICGQGHEITFEGEYIIINPSNEHRKA